MSASPSRTVLALVVATLVLASTAGPVVAEPTTAQAQQQPLVTELDLDASLTGELVVIAGWFELTALVEGGLNTSAQETDFGSTVDVGLAETFGEFEVRGELVGAVDASRILFAFEENASSLGIGSVAPPAASSAAGGASRTAGLAGGAAPQPFDSGSAERIEPATVGDPVGRLASHAEPAASSIGPVQLRPFRRLGISFFDLYWQLATLVLGLVVVGVLPSFSRRVADLGAGDPLRTVGAGLAVALVVPVVLLVLGLSLFGIPLAVAGAAVYLVLWWVGAVYGRFTVGLWLLGAVPRVLEAVGVDVGSVENRWAGLLVGVAVVGLLVLVPTVGPAFETAAVLLGLGGLSRLAYRAYHRTERAERAATAGTVPLSDDE
jgi:hypothetical protein